MTGAEEFGAELADFRSRVDELRTARALPAQERLSALDAALFELEHAADVLWPRYEELAAAARGGAEGLRGQSGQEQQLLRALFQRMPMAVALLDRETVVRRLNFAATQLFGMRAGFATGRRLTGSLRHDGRAALRGQVAAVARGEGARSLLVHLPGGRAGAALRVTLTALRPSGELRNAVLAVFQPAADGERPGPAPAASKAAQSKQVAAQGSAAGPYLAEVTRHAELMDLLDAMATALLGRRAGGPAELLERAARVLQGQFADWVVADLNDGGTLRRVVVLGPSQADGLRAAVAEGNPADCPLVVEATAAGTSALQVRPDDPELFGRDGDGAALLVRAEVTSLVCVPLRPGPASPVRGALTLLRSGARHAFEMAEAGVVDRISRHVALAMAAVEPSRGRDTAEAAS
ncbi:PAS domain-containing protein [Streptomyces sp. NPDC050610]|uniref:PAS domain-containing protein n=1 Tax=Streptomyces sp. NPDC050610 TaxID=3157097 RepID=UPI003421E565